VNKGLLLLVLVLALLTAKAISQEIVIEPTNGRAESRNHLSRPAAVDSSPKVAKPRKAKSSTQPAKRAPAKQMAAKSKDTVAASLAVPSVPEAEKSETPAVVSAPAKTPARPDWAMSATRDSHSLQIEIASALSHDPKLRDSAITVSVDDELVTLQGLAAGPEERLQAQRLAKSYAWDRKLADHIEVTPVVSAQK
jgi:hypothetical protein